MEDRDQLFFGNQRFLTVRQAAVYLGISPRTIYDQIGRKSRRAFPVRPKRIGRAIRFDITELNDFIQSI